MTPQSRPAPRSRRRLLICLLASCSLASATSYAEPVSTEPVAGHDYHSLQLASGDASELATLFERYRSLPYLRIERRGALHVLRAGFWASRAQAARAWQTQAAAPSTMPLLRAATYRPEQITLSNWFQAAATTTTPPIAALRKEEIAVLPALTFAPEPAPQDATKQGAASFNAEDYQLAFDAFIAAGDQVRAFALARKAVAARPDDVQWRRHLARLAEWTQRPLMAWEHWAWLLAHGQRDEETLTAVTRLAPLVGEPNAALTALAQLAHYRPLSEAQWQDIRTLYEEAGRQRDGARYFEQQALLQMKAQPARAAQFLDWAAQLAQRVGDDEKALQLYRQRIDLPTASAPFTLTPVLGAVLILLRQDRLREAFDLMQSQRLLAGRVADDDYAFWRLLANTAWELAETEVAKHAFSRYAQAPDASASDWSRLIHLTREHAPEQASALAIEAWRRYHNIDYLLHALSLQAEQGDRAGQARVFAELSSEERTRAEGQVRFLLLRSQWHQSEARPDEAWGDLRRALGLAPNDSDVQLAAAWHLIDSGRRNELAALLPQLHAQAESSPAQLQTMALVLAAGYQQLGKVRNAAHWYRQALRRTPDDPLLLLSYADVLEQQRQAGMAARIRRHAFLSLRAKHPTTRPDAPQPGPELLALTRLQLRNAHTDVALEQIRAVAARLRSSPLKPSGTTPPTPADDLILAWALSNGQTDNARAWLWLRQARRAEALSPGDRHDDALSLGDWPQARSIAFTSLSDNDVDEDMYERFRLNVPGHSNYLQLHLARQRFGTLAANPAEIEGRWQAGRELALTVGWSNTSETLDDLTQSWLPHRERLGRIGAHWQGEVHDTRGELWQRDEFDKTTGARLSHQYRANRRLTLSGELATRAEADLTTAMRLAGAADSLQLAANWQVGKRETLRLSPRWQRLYTQTGDYLGGARTLDFDAIYQVHLDYPDTRLRAFVSDQRITANGRVSQRTLDKTDDATRELLTAGTIDPLALFLPASSRTGGLCLSMGENIGGQNLRDVYSRAWRGFYDVCRTRNDLNGSGHTLSAGIAGSLTGNDHLLLSIENSRGGAGSGADTRQMHLRYRQYF